MTVTASSLVPRATIGQIAQRRNRALDLYAEAHGMVTAANDKLREAGEMLRSAAPTANMQGFEKDRREKIFASYGVAPRDEFLGLARHMVDADIWAHVVTITDLERLMDKKAKEELRKQLLVNPVEFTEETAMATLEGFLAESGNIFRRGIAEVFSNLDRRFRSHDGFKIGARVIIDGMFGVDGYWNYYRNHRDTLQDIERTFHVLEGKPVRLQYAGIVGKIEEARQRQGGLMAGARQTELESDYYRVRIFKNGNCHLWFKRDDLVQQINRLLGEYYGEVIPDGQAPEDDGALHEAKRTPAKYFGFFPTPQPLVDWAVDAAKLYRSPDAPAITLLEPSAGTGNLARGAARAGADVTCVEIQHDYASGLALEGIYHKVWPHDFLSLSPDVLGQFDRVLMNPPFDRERDIDHVMHALKFLKSGGRLVAIMSAHTEFAETRKASAFRDHMGKLKGHFSDLPRNSFASVGTNVNTILLTVFADGREHYA